MTATFALAGGVSLGTVEVGMLRALLERGIRPDLVVGTSAGTLNSAPRRPARPRRRTPTRRGAARPDPAAGVPAAPVDTALGLGGLGDHLISLVGLRRIVRDNPTYGRLEEAPLPVHVVATDITGSLEVLLSEGDPVGAVLASSTLPAVFLPVHIEDRTLVDGEVADDTPVSQAAALGTERIYVLPTGFPCALRRPLGSMLAVVLQTLVVMLSQRLVLGIRRLRGEERDLWIVPPLCSLGGVARWGASPADFGQPAS